MKIKMWYKGKYEYVDVTDKYVYMAKCGTGHTVFAVEAKFVKETLQHLVWEIKNGIKVKTNEQGWGVGKAKDLFLIIKDEPLQFCDREKGIKTDYINGLIF